MNAKPPFSQDLRTAFQRILDPAPCAAFEVSVEGMIRGWDRGAERLSGYSRAETLGRDLTILDPPDRLGGSSGIVREVARTGEPQVGRAAQKCKDGRLVELSLSASPVVDQAGAVAAVQVTAVELAQKDQFVDLALRMLEAFEHAELGLSACSTDSGRLQVVNRAFARLHGYPSAREMIGLPIRSLFTEECRTAAEEALRSGQEFGQCSFEATGLRKDGTTFPELVGVSGVSDESGASPYRILNVHDLTEICRTRTVTDGLRRREEDLDDLFENAPVGVHWLAEDGTILRANRFELDLLGYASGEYVGRPIENFYVEPREARETHDRLKRDGLVTAVPARLRARDGSVRDVLLDSNVLRDSEGRFVRSRCFIRDVTNEKRALEETRRHQALRDAVLEGTTDAIFAKDLSGRLVLANGAFAAFFGKTLEQVLGKTDAELFGAEVARTLRKNDLSALEDGRPRRVEETLSHGFPTRAFQTIKAPLRDDHGEVIGILGVARDVTDEKRRLEWECFRAKASALLSESLDPEEILLNLTYLAVLEFSDWCVVHLRGPDGSARPAASAHRNPEKAPFLERLVEGYPSGPAATRGLLRVLETGEADLAPVVTDQTLREEAMNDEHLALLRSLSPNSVMCVPIEARGRVLGTLTLCSSEYGRRFDPFDLEAAVELGLHAGLAFDHARLYQESRRELERRTRAEQELAKLNSDLESRDRTRSEDLARAVDELRSFAYTVAHDLRAPLRAVAGFCEVVAEDYEGRVLDGTGQEYLRGAAQSARKMDELIQALLSFNALSTAQPESRPVDLSQAVREVLELMAAEFEERVARVRVAENLGCILGSETLIREVVAKLLSNAVRFVRRGTSPEIRIWTESRPGNRIRLWVEDNGIGIPAPYHELIFGVFQRLHTTEAYPGVGIGLAIARKAVERMGGGIGVESEPDRGSRFWIELPAADG